jgi:SIR2-like domain
MRRVVLFGNGLGRALDNDAFDLGRAIQEVCADRSQLSEDELRCLAEFLDKEPCDGIDEPDLMKLHTAIFACDFLRTNARGQAEILTEQGARMPTVFGKFVHGVATNLASQNFQLPEPFTTALAAHIRQNLSHIATLNYDTLLYSALLSEGLFNGYQGHLVDGLTDAGYRHENLQAQGQNDFGLYLHLHGSPLVYESHGRIRKRQRGALQFQFANNESGRHLVLTSVDYKTAVIEQSPLLASYWRWFAWALRGLRNSELIVFGASANDTHLIRTVCNQLDRSNAIRVVEWSGEPGDRQAFWEGHFEGQGPVRVVGLDDILEFDDW